MVRRLALARFAALLGASMVPTALAFGVLALPGATASSLGVILAASVGGQTIMLVPGGVLADRLPRRNVMIAAETLAGAAPLVMGALVLSEGATTLNLAILGALGGLTAGLFAPAFTGFVPEVAAPAALQSTNALLRLSVNTARILGTAVSGILIAWQGPGEALIASGLAGLLAAVLLARVRPRHVVEREPARRLCAEAAVGWHEFRARRWVVAVVVLGAVSNLGIAASLGVLGPLRASDSYQGASSWAIISSSLAAGTLIGAGVAVLVRTARPLIVAMLALGLFSLPLAALAAELSMVLVLPAAFVAGLALEVFSVLWDTSLQKHVPNQVLSRVSAFDWLGSYALSPIALVVVGPLVESFGITAALWLAFAFAATPPLALFESQVRTLSAGGPSAA